jgi:hypothetical protein
MLGQTGLIVFGLTNGLDEQFTCVLFELAVISLVT